MTDDASLFDFDEGTSDAEDDGGRSADADTGGEDPAGASGPAAESDGDPAADVDPATATYRWSPDPAACPDCGTDVRRRWRDGDAFVCADCKDW